MSALEQVLAEVGDERERQEAKWGQQDHPWRTGWPWQSVQAADMAKGDVDYLAEEGRLDYAGILTEEYHEALEARTIEEQRAELIQVAAVAVAAIESLDRNGR